MPPETLSFNLPEISSSPSPPSNLLMPISLDPPTAPSLPQPPSFASLFKENRNLAKCIPLDSSVVCEDGDTIVALDDDLLSIEDAFGHALLGFVIGGVASPRLIHALIKSWDVSCSFSTHYNGWILFKFGTKVEMMKVLENGPYSILGRQWMIKEVPKYFSFKDSCFSCVPIWVNLKFLPKQCWSKPLLSRIARRIGRPIAMDVVTGDKSKHEGARILVEVDLGKPIVDKVSITMPDGRIWDQSVAFDIKPVVCTKCKGLGHDVEACAPVPPRQPRGRSMGRRGKSRRPNASSAKPNGEGEGGSDSRPSTSILSAMAKDKGKGKVDEVVAPSLESSHAEGSKEGSTDWQMVLPKKLASPSPSNGMVSSTPISGAKGSNPSIHELMEQLLPMSPNTFSPLFEEDERAPMAKGIVKAVARVVEDPDGMVAKNTRGRVGDGVKEEDLRRSGRRRRGISSS